MTSSKHVGCILANRICIAETKQSCKSERKSSQPSEPSQSPPAWSFLFTVDELKANDDPTQGGVAPRYNDNGRWIPPVEINGFHPPTRGLLYRWTNGNITVATDCQLWEGHWWSGGPDRHPLEAYNTKTIFWCNSFEQFQTANGTANTRDMEESDHPDNRWWPLTFRHDGALSRVEESSQDGGLAGTRREWIGQLGLNAYNNYGAPRSTGLAGQLPIVIALIAFSCRARDLNRVLITDQAWGGYRWAGHHRPDGSKSSRANHR
jgi:hypothetical protein